MGSIENCKSKSKIRMGRQSFSNYNFVQLQLRGVPGAKEYFERLTSYFCSAVNNDLLKVGHSSCLENRPYWNSGKADLGHCFPSLEGQISKASVSYALQIGVGACTGISTTLYILGLERGTIAKRRQSAYLSDSGHDSPVSQHYCVMCILKLI